MAKKSNLLELETLCEMYDEERIKYLVYGSNYYHQIKNLVDIIREAEPEKEEKLDNIVKEIYEGEDWEASSSEIKENLEKVRKTVEDTEFIKEIKSTVYERFLKKHHKGNLDNVIDSYVRAIIKYKSLDILKEDERLKKFVAKAAKTFKAPGTRTDPEEEQEEEEIIEKIPEDENQEERIIQRQRDKIIWRNILKLEDPDQKTIALLSLRDLDPRDIAEIWPVRITNAQISQKKRAMEDNLADLLANDPQFRELRNL